MVKKQIQKHDFLNDGPILQYELPLFNDINQRRHNNFITINDHQTQVIPQFTLNGVNGDNIFTVNTDVITYQNQSLVTEDRLKEIVREMMDEYFIPVREVQE